MTETIYQYKNGSNLSIKEEPYKKVVIYLQLVDDVNNPDVKVGVKAIVKPYHPDVKDVTLYDYACKYIRAYEELME